MRLTILILAACVVGMSGCAASHNIGEASDSPGVEVRGPSLFYPARIKVTSDCNAELDDLQYGELKLKGARFGQSASAVVKEEPAKIAAIGEAQSAIAKARGEAIAQGIHASADVIDSLIPILGWLQMGNLTPHETGATLKLPGGLELGGHKITGNAELQETLAQLLTQAQAAKSSLSTAQAATSQPSN